MVSFQARMVIVAAIAWPSAMAVAREADLSKVDRSIRKEPVWASGKPQYCLFVMLKGDAWDYVIPGEPQYGMSVINAERRVWFVVDGDDLYMDVNENGDLTDPGEKLPRLELSDKERREAKIYSRWRIPDIKGTDGEPMITNIQIDRNTEKGAALGAKVVYFSAPARREAYTTTTFADRPADAPILHVTGPYRLSLAVRRSHLPANRAVANDFHVDGHVYVDGLGRGTRFLLESSNLNCRIEFPLADGSTEVQEFRLRNYITGPYQTAIATLPDGVDDDGKVKITLSTHVARRPAVDPVVVEKLPADLRAVRRENK